MSDRARVGGRVRTQGMHGMKCDWCGCEESGIEAVRFRGVLLYFCPTHSHDFMHRLVPRLDDYTAITRVGRWTWRADIASGLVSEFAFYRTRRGAERGARKRIALLRRGSGPCLDFRRCSCDNGPDDPPAVGRVGDG